MFDLLLRNLLVVHELLEDLPFIIVGFHFHHVRLQWHSCNVLLEAHFLRTTARKLLHNVWGAMAQNSHIIVHPFHDRNVMVIRRSFHLI